MMGLKEAFAMVQQQKNTIPSMGSFLAGEFPDTIRALRLIDYDHFKNKRRKGFSLVKRENKKLGFVYYVRYSHDGKMLPTKWNTHTNVLEEAERFARENRTRLVEQYVRSRDMEMYAFFEHFYEPDSDLFICEEQRNRKVSERSRQDYYANTVNRFIPFLQKRKIKYFNEITAHVWGDYQDSLLAEKIKPQTVNNIFKHLKRIFQYLFRKGVISENPYEGVHYLTVHQSDQEARGCYELGKLQGVFNRKWKDELSYLLCMVIYTTGIRNNEIGRFKMGDIQLINGCHFIDIKKSKTASGIRLVPLHDFVYKKLKAYSAGKDADKPVFGGIKPRYSPMPLKSWERS
jgi:hypothetical protein